MNEKIKQWLIAYQQKIKKISLTPQVFKFLPIVLILLALPVALFLVNHQTNISSSAQITTKPDIVVVMVDDLGAIDERIQNKLPNIKSLFIEQGMRFDNAYNETPLCCPGRATFLTAQHTQKHGVTYNDARLLNSSYTIATALQQTGYYTIAAGKYLNGAEKLSDKTPPGWDKMAMLLSWDTNVSSKWAVQGNIQTGGFYDRFATNKSLNWVQNAPRNQPIFLWLNPHAPHYRKGYQNSPWVVDVEKRYLSDSRCNNIPSWKPLTYYNSKERNGFPLDNVCKSLLTTDEAVGALQREFAKQGRNPIWIFTSDNGMSWGRDGFPLKNVTQSDKTPLYFSGPGITPGSTSALVSNIDLGPTIAELAGTSMPKADGLSYAPVILGNSNDFRDMLAENHPLGGTTGSSPSRTGPWWGVRTPQWHLVEWSKWRGEALYDVLNDPWEIKNVASSNPDLVRQLKKWGQSQIDISAATAEPPAEYIDTAEDE